MEEAGRDQAPVLAVGDGWQCETAPSSVSELPPARRALRRAATPNPTRTQMPDQDVGERGLAP